MTLLLHIITMLLAFSATTILIPFLDQWAKSKGWLVPSDERRRHREIITSLGGVAIMAGLLLGAGSLQVFTDDLWLAWLPAALLLFGTGAWDDLFELSAGFRLGVQILIGIWFWQCGIALPLAWYWSAPLTVGAFILLINAYNFIDGINGLAATLGIVGAGWIGWQLFLLGDLAGSQMAAVYGAALLGFWRLNFGHRARIFMGDSGSTVMGLTLGVLAWRWYSATADATFQPSQLVPMTLALALPVVDLLRVAIQRLHQGRSPLSPDRTHLHHLLVDPGFTHPQAVFLITVTYLVQLTLTALVPDLLTNFLLTGAILLLPYGIVLMGQFATRYATKQTIGAHPASDQ